jgi:chitinase
MLVARLFLRFCAYASRVRIAAFVILLAASTITAGSEPRRPTSSTRHSLLVGYFPQWGLYDEDKPYTVKSLIESGAATLLDHLNYAQGFVSNGRCSVADPNADLNYTFAAETSVDGSADSPSASFRGNFHQLVELKRLYPRLKILISLEGHASDFAADAKPEARAAFVASCVNLFLKGNFGPQTSVSGLFDGIDLDWEYPGASDGVNYSALVAEFRRQMDAFRPGLVLSVALGTSPEKYGDADIPAIGRLVDIAGLMTYDYNGPWTGTTGLIAPLVSTSPDDGSVQTSIAAWKQAGIPAAKMLLGLPFYAYGWLNVPAGNHGLGQNGRPYRGDHPYWFIQTIIHSQRARPAQSGTAAVPQGSATEAAPPSGAVIYRDPVSQAPWLLDGSNFWTYEDPVSIQSKAAFVVSQQMAGFMVWELSEDTSSATLLSAAHTALAHPVIASLSSASAQRRSAFRPTP